MAEGKRKLWTEESMEAATRSVLDENRSLREASRLYNVPFETLRQRVHGYVMPGCRPGPATVLTEEEEDQLALYLTQMSDMGFGLSRDTVMCLAFKIVDRAQCKHPFKDQKAGRATRSALNENRSLRDVGEDSQRETVTALASASLS